MSLSPLYFFVQVGYIYGQIQSTLSKYDRIVSQSNQLGLGKELSQRKLSGEKKKKKKKFKKGYASS